MKIRDAIISVMKSKGITQTELAKQFGRKNQSFISERLNVKSMSIDNICEILQKMDYEVVIRPKEGQDGAAYTISTEQEI